MKPSGWSWPTPKGTASPDDAVADPEAYLSDHLDRLVILDEVHRVPGLFPILRGLIDRGRRSGRTAGLYLLLGSASFQLLRQSGESLAGRVTHLELGPFNVLEVATGQSELNRLWVRGGFPESFLAGGGELSHRWREDFIQTYLERHIPQFGAQIPAETLRRLWTMLSHNQGGVLNAAKLARNIYIDVRTVSKYLDLLVDLLLVRKLPPWSVKVGKRLTKSPKVYVRDSGLVHALLAVREYDSLLSHPVVGASWEGFVIEQILNVKSNHAQAYFYRTHGGAELDLLLVWPDNTKWAIEIKRTTPPRPSRGFCSACEDVNPTRRFIAYPGNETYQLSKDVTVIAIADLAALARRGPLSAALPLQ